MTDDLPLWRDTLAEARRTVLAHIEDGMHCPCCGQMAKRYRRKINSSMARTLIALRREDAQFVHVANLGRALRLDVHEVSQLSWWGLVEEDCRERDDGGRAGFWRLTESGRAFIAGQIKVPQYCYVYDAQVKGFSDNMVSIQECLGQRFNYAELMGWSLTYSEP